jgi:antitoxin component of MazEF toxin-antitoxin module
MKMGEGGLVVCLPKAWAQFYGVKPGDKVIVRVNGKLVITPIREVKKKPDKS